MSNKYAKIFGKWEKISVGVVCVLTFLISAVFAYWAGFYTNSVPMDLSIERAFEARDSILGNLLFFAGWCAICMVIWRLISQKDKEQQNKLLHRIVIVLCCILAVILICWLRISHYEPEADQYHVYSSAVEMLMGDYACMDFANYMDFYPFQLDLAFLFQMAFKLFGSTDISVIQNINVAGIVLTIYLGYWVLREITDELPAQICYIMFSYSMVPLFLYVGYVYGDVISLCAANIAILSVIRWCRTHKKRYAVLLILSMMVGCMARRTIYITLIAIVIGLLYHVIKERCWKSLIIVFLCIMMSVGISKAVTGYYEKQSGFPGGQGLPISYRLNTGVQESILGAGQYNWNLLLEYYDVNLDYVMFDEHSKQLLKSRIKEFISSPPMLFDFYRRKLMEQWNDHTFSSAYAMSRVEEEMGEVEYSVFYGDIRRFTEKYMNYYLFVLYTGVAISALYMWRQHKEIYLLIPYIALIGGFLFFLLWEAMGRYALPYVILVQPFAATGIGLLIMNAWGQVSKRYMRKRNAKNLETR